jgi:hypothetical protein
MTALLRERLIAPAAPFDLSVYLGEGDVAERPLTRLLGAYDGVGLDNAYRNGRPNAANMALWHLVSTELARELGATCDAGATPRWTLAQPAAAALAALCSWPSPAARSDAALDALWDVLVRYDAPPSERDAWKAFARDPALTATGGAAVEALVTAILLNPYLLLAH